MACSHGLISFGIVPLVIVGGVGKRNRDRRNARDGKFGEGRSAGATNDQVGARQYVGHVIDKRCDASFVRQRLISGLGCLDVVRAGLMNDLPLRGKRL